MQLTGHITPESLMTLEAYTKWRKVHKPEVIAHRKLRSVQLGDHVNLQFESETTIRYQIPCHGRVQNIGRKTEEMLKMIPGTEINTIERCSGHAGTYGVKKGSHDMAMKIGKPVFKAMATMKDGSKPDFISSDCPLGVITLRKVLK